MGSQRSGHYQEDPSKHAIGEETEFRFFRNAEPSKVYKLIKFECRRRAENENSVAIEPRCI